MINNEVTELIIINNIKQIKHLVSMAGFRRQYHRPNISHVRTETLVKFI
ncbi:MAG: hypothetical protein JWQ06_194 [Mucilaginibacter sp.]|nr:hypothetical protein [Mucilaginibacter sp.]